MNPELTKDPVSCTGYSRSDLSGYYSGTFLLYKDGDVYRSCYVRGVEGGREDVTFYIRYTDEDGELFDTEVQGRSNIESLLYRMVMPNGWYLQSHKPPFKFSYQVNRSYKKGLSPDFIRVSDINGDSRRVTSKLLDHMVYPRDHFSQDKRLISRRLAVYNGNVYTTYKNLTVGRVSGGQLDTPFHCIRQRMEEQ